MNITIDQILDAVESGEDIGLCTTCGVAMHGVEPDARGYVCEACGEPAVCGAEELLLALGGHSTEDM
jgi:predicted RNA-binding Zn-ribbon protein involved in translation (DUF1610 family)